MRWICVTSDASKHIVPVQQHLFRKYLGFEPEYVSHYDMKISDWCKTVNVSVPLDEPIIFGLDDYLPFAYPPKVEPPMAGGWDRIGFSYGDSVQAGMVPAGLLFRYTDLTPYSVTCQFSMWQSKSLREVTARVNGSPWDFEIKGRCIAYALANVEKWYIEESALSKRWPGKINLNGLSAEDVEELISLGLVDESKLINAARLTVAHQ